MRCVLLFVFCEFRFVQFHDGFVCSQIQASNFHTQQHSVGLLCCQHVSLINHIFISTSCQICFVVFWLHLKIKIHTYNFQSPQPINGHRSNMICMLGMRVLLEFSQNQIFYESLNQFVTIVNQSQNKVRLHSWLPLITRILTVRFTTATQNQIVPPSHRHIVF